MGVRFPRFGTAIYRTPQWKSVRYLAKRRDGWKCVQCSAKGRLEVDHITPIRDGGAPYDLANLQSLCPKCHSRKTRVEVGLAELSPARAAWKSLLKEMETTNA